MKTIYKILLLNSYFVIISCGNRTESEKEGANDAQHSNFIIVSEAQFNQAHMVLDSLKRRLFTSGVTVNGMIDVPPENRAEVNATMGGYIKKTPLLIGDKVRKGQVLVTIENPEFVSLQQEYLEIHEQLTYLKAEYERQRIMKKENITSQKNFLKAESEYKVSVAKYKGLAKQLAMLNISTSNALNGTLSSVATIYAPISGSVTKVNVSKGSYVSPATTIMEIIDNDHMHLELSVFEKDILKVKKGQIIEFKIPEASELNFTAEVHLVGTVIEENRTIKVHGHIDENQSQKFLTGMFVEAVLVTDSTTVNALPTEAVKEINDEKYVLVLDRIEDGNYYFTQHDVITKATSNNFVEIGNENEFKPDTQFLTKGAFELLGEVGAHDH
ncbi:efflux RND transporter periplasmic adaptor subunit [Kriegella sp. EG-1]|nr:efflux RND transporter periplasmic adaptor subunit [Flavobacteriaceae bacterium EG-1]